MDRLAAVAGSLAEPGSLAGMSWFAGRSAVVAGS